MYKFLYCLIAVPVEYVVWYVGAILIIFAKKT